MIQERSQHIFIISTITFEYLNNESSHFFKRIKVFKVRTFLRGTASVETGQRAVTEGVFRPPASGAAV